MIERTTRLLLFIAGCIAVLVAAYSLFLYSAATKADTANDIRTGQLLRGEAERHLEVSLADLDQIARSDQLFEAVQAGDVFAAMTDLCLAGGATGRFVTLGVIESNGTPRFLCEGGQVKDIREHGYVFESVKPLLRDAFEATTAAQRDYGSVFPEFVFHRQYAMLADRPYLVIAALVAPQSLRPLTPGYRPVIVFGFSGMRTALQGLETQLAISGLRIEEAARSPDVPNSMVLEDPRDGNIITALWDPSFAFRGQLTQALPVIISLTLIVLLVAFSFMRRIARLQQSLVGQEAEMRHMALHDVLTGLPNRANFVRQAGAAMAGASTASPLYIGLFDLDWFKQVNDSFGHDAGDRLIIEAARRAAGVLGPDDLLARLGGDEFALILQHAGSDADAVARLDGMRLAIAAPFATAGATLLPNASVGAARIDRSGVALDEALKMADIALYEVKTSGRGRTRLFRERRAVPREAEMPMARPC